MYTPTGKITVTVITCGILSVRQSNENVAFWCQGYGADTLQNPM